MDITNRVIHIKSIFNKKKLKQLRVFYKKLKTIENTNLAKLTKKEALAISRGESSHNLRLRKEWFLIFKKNKKISKILDDYNFIMYPCQVRSVSKVKDLVPWHQDRAYMKLLKKKAPKKVITIFLPLNDEPWRCSSLEFGIVKKVKEYRHRKINLFAKGFDQKFNNIKKFKMQLGDALIFDDMMPHRTFIPKNPKEDRISLEFRITKKSYLTKNKDFFNIEKNKFIRN